MCPDLELTRWPFTLLDGAQSTEPHRWGLKCILYLFLLRSLKWACPRFFQWLPFSNRTSALRFPCALSTRSALFWGVWNQQSSSPLHPCSCVDLILDVAWLVYSPFKISSSARIIILIPVSQIEAKVAFGLWLWAQKPQNLWPQATPWNPSHLWRFLEWPSLLMDSTPLWSISNCGHLEHYIGIVYWPV